jgi:hypothetical protein
MFEIFIAIFGILFYALYVGSEKSVRKRTAVQYARKDRMREEWIASVTNPEGEAAIKEFLAKKDYAAIKEQTKDVYDIVFQSRPFSELYPMSSRPKCYQKLPADRVQSSVRLHRNFALWILCAKQGFLPEMNARFDSGVGIYLGIPLYYEIYHWCIEELQRQGVDIVLKKSPRINWVIGPAEGF